MIPDLPKSVKEHMGLDRHLAKQAKLKTINDTMHIDKGDRKDKEVDTADWIML